MQKIRKPGRGAGEGGYGGREAEGSEVSVHKDEVAAGKDPVTHFFLLHMIRGPSPALSTKKAWTCRKRFADSFRARSSLIREPKLKKKTEAARARVALLAKVPFVLFIRDNSSLCSHCH